jgi:hypothetical protein
MNARGVAFAFLFFGRAERERKSLNGNFLSVRKCEERMDAMEIYSE